jgi:hypothetical protein
MEVENEHAQPADRKRSSKLPLLITGAGLVLLLITGGWWLTHHNSDPLPATIRSQVRFGLYYPAKLPAGWHVKKDSFAVSQGVVFYLVEGTKGVVTVSIQPRPATFDYATFYEKGLSGTFQFTTPAGQAALGHANNRLMGSLVGDDSWVLLSPDSSDVPQSDLQAILSSLRKT